MPQSHFCIVSKGSPSGGDAWEVRVYLDTRICHVTNPLGRLVVTLKNTALPQVIAPGKHGTEDNVDFYFDLREGQSL
ncbi:hypothetical protein LB505_011942 [Fusarium chuoi]|nr:hypothetical protein LB505_011942 [Fusarium chuoi]